MQVSKRIPFDDPDVLNIVRALYIGSNVIIAGIYVYVQFQINKKKGTILPLETRHYTHNYTNQSLTYRSHHAQIRRTGSDGIFGGGQACDHHRPSLRLAATQELFPIADYGSCNDGLYAPIHEVHQPALDPIHHPAQGRPRVQLGQDPPPRPAGDW